MGAKTWKDILVDAINYGPWWEVRPVDPEAHDMGDVAWLWVAEGWESYTYTHGAHQSGDLLRITPLRAALDHLYTGARFAIPGVAAIEAPTTAREFVVIAGPAADLEVEDVAIVRIEPPLRHGGAAPTVVELPNNNALIIQRR